MDEARHGGAYLKYMKKQGSDIIPNIRRDKLCD